MVENHPGSGIKISSLLMSLCTIMQVPHSSTSQAQSHMRRRRCGRLAYFYQSCWRAWMLVTMIAWPAQPWRVSGLPASIAHPLSARAFSRSPATATRSSRCAHNVLTPGSMHIETSCHCIWSSARSHSNLSWCMQSTALCAVATRVHCCAGAERRRARGLGISIQAWEAVRLQEVPGSVAAELRSTLSQAVATFETPR